MKGFFSRREGLEYWCGGKDSEGIVEEKRSGMIIVGSLLIAAIHSSRTAPEGCFPKAGMKIAQTTTKLLCGHKQNLGRCGWAWKNFMCRFVKNFSTVWVFWGHFCTEHSLLEPWGTGLLICPILHFSVVPWRGKVASFKKAGGTFGRQRCTVALVFLDTLCGAATQTWEKLCAFCDLQCK